MGHHVRAVQFLVSVMTNISVTANYALCRVQGGEPCQNLVETQNVHIQDAKQQSFHADVMAQYCLEKKKQLQPVSLDSYYDRQVLYNRKF
jgi:hypothetical protein